MRLSDGYAFYAVGHRSIGEYLQNRMLQLLYAYIMFFCLASALTQFSIRRGILQFSANMQMWRKHDEKLTSSKDVSMICIIGMSLIFLRFFVYHVAIAIKAVFRFGLASVIDVRRVLSAVIEQGKNSGGVCDAGISSCSTCFINGSCHCQDAGVVGAMEG